MKNKISLFFKLTLLLLSLYFIISEIYFLMRVNPNLLTYSNELFTYIVAFKTVLIFMALPAFWVMKILDYFDALPEEISLFESRIFYKSMSLIVSILVIISLIESFLK